MRSFLLTILFCLFFCSSALAQNNDSSLAGESAEQSDERNILPENAILLGEVEESGIMALAWIDRLPPVSVENGQQKQAPYRLFLRFLSVESNVAIEKGLVAHKIENMEGVKTPAVKMEFEDGYFMDDLDNISPGHYTLHVGSKLEDEKKRQFQYELMIR